MEYLGIACNVSRLNDILYAVQERYELKDSYERCIQFMLSCLALVRDVLPETAKKALEVAERHWAGEPQDLDAARVICWDYLDKARYGSGTPITKPEESGARAVICVLHSSPEPDDDILDVLGWFHDFISEVEDIAEEEIRLLREHFPGIN